MMTKTLTDDTIVKIARKTDEFIMEIGKEFEPSGIEFSAIVLGRLMIFTKQVGCSETFQEMLKQIALMGEPEPIFPEEKS